MTERIRWKQRGSCEDWTGYIGSEMLFHIFATGRDRVGWAMVNSLPGISDQTAKGEVADDPDAGKLKAEAERWLERFVSSLGAAFGDAIAADLRSRAGELEAMVCREPGQERDNLLFSAGLKRAADLIEHGDQPAAAPATPAPMAGEKE